MTAPSGDRAPTAGQDKKRVSSPFLGRGRTILARLREEAGRLVAFSESRLLVREAAFTIERLEREVERLQAELTRVTNDLERERSLTRAPAQR